MIVHRVYVSQVYRSVLLNNGRRTRTHTCTATTPVSDPSQNENESQDSTASQPFDIDQMAMELGGDSNVDSILYRSDIDIGTRGDIIQFYNKIYIGYIKDFVLKLSPDDVSNGWMDGWMNGWMDGRMDRWMGVWTDRWIDR